MKLYILLMSFAVLLAMEDNNDFILQFKENKVIKTRFSRDEIDQAPPKKENNNFPLAEAEKNISSNKNLLAPSWGTKRQKIQDELDMQKAIAASLLHLSEGGSVYESHQNWSDSPAFPKHPAQITPKDQTLPHKAPSEKP